MVVLQILNVSKQFPHPDNLCLYFVVTQHILTYSCPLVVVTLRFAVYGFDLLLDSCVPA